MPWYYEALLSIPAGLLLGNFTEWWFHRFVLHGLGRTRGTFWSFHFHEHHRNSRQHAFYDPCYRRFPLGWHAQGLISGAPSAQFSPTASGFAWRIAFQNASVT